MLDCSFISPYDTINDNLKMLEDAINQCGLKDVIKIGLEFNANDLYKPDLKKYEMENPNPKNFLDLNQLVNLFRIINIFKVDFYFKLCTDKPSIGYLEDPIIADDPDGWTKLKVLLQKH
jgi:enolase